MDVLTKVMANVKSGQAMIFPKCALAGVLTELIKRIIGLRAKYSTGNGSFFRRWMPRAGRGFSGRVSIGGPADLRPAVGIWVPREPGMVG